MAGLVITYSKKRRHGLKRKQEQSCDNAKRSRRVCQFCMSDQEDEVDFGAIYEKEDITVHYFCMLLSSGLIQNTRETDRKSILGFVLSDIKKELLRGAKLKCCYCQNKGATIGCCVKSCRKVFHLSCGRENRTMHQFFDSFRSYCENHRLEQKLPNEMSMRRSMGKLCSICLCRVTSFDSCDTLIATCCSKSLFHRRCLQQYALSAGLHYFKCPLCNSVKEFQKDMTTFGIYIPDQDASWEKEPNAFHELLERHDSCDVTKCLCPQGRQFDADSGKYELLLCGWCGAYGSHRQCEGLVWRGNSLVCCDCADIIDRAEVKQQEENKSNQTEKRDSLQTDLPLPRLRCRSSSLCVDELVSLSPTSSTASIHRQETLPQSRNSPRRRPYNNHRKDKTPAGKVKRGRGRPKGSGLKVKNNQQMPVTGNSPKRRSYTNHRKDEPPAGKVKRGRGRPRGSSRKDVAPTGMLKRGRGRPKGSGLKGKFQHNQQMPITMNSPRRPHTNYRKDEAPAGKVKRGRGRPRGSGLKREVKLSQQMPVIMFPGPSREGVWHASTEMARPRLKCTKEATTTAETNDSVLLMQKGMSAKERDVPLLDCRVVLRKIDIEECSVLVKESEKKCPHQNTTRRDNSCFKSLASNCENKHTVFLNKIKTSAEVHRPKRYRIVRHPTRKFNTRFSSIDKLPELTFMGDTHLRPIEYASENDDPPVLETGVFWEPLTRKHEPRKKYSITITELDPKNVCEIIAGQIADNSSLYDQIFPSLSDTPDQGSLCDKSVQSSSNTPDNDIACDQVLQSSRNTLHINPVPEESLHSSRNTTCSDAVLDVVLQRTSYAPDNSDLEQLSCHSSNTSNYSVHEKILNSSSSISNRELFYNQSFRSSISLLNSVSTKEQISKFGKPVLQPSKSSLDSEMIDEQIIQDSSPDREVIVVRNLQVSSTDSEIIDKQTYQNSSSSPDSEIIDKQIQDSSPKNELVMDQIISYPSENEMAQEDILKSSFTFCTSPQKKSIGMHFVNSLFTCSLNSTSNISARRSHSKDQRAVLNISNHTNVPGTDWAFSLEM